MNYVYVLAESRRIFEAVCRVDWGDPDPSRREYVVFTGPHDVRHYKGRRWQEGDELHVLGEPSYEQREHFRAVMLPTGVPREEMERVGLL